jgi:hypothetical protein
LSTTSPPHRSDSHVDVTSGVRFTTLAPAVAARSMSASLGAGALVTAPASRSRRD